MVNPDRDPLTGTVEVDEASLPFRRKTDPVAGGQGRSALGKMLLVGAVEIRDIERHGLPTTMPGRIRLATIPNDKRPTLHRFFGGTIENNSLVSSVTAYPPTVNSRTTGTDRSSSDRWRHTSC